MSYTQSEKIKRTTEALITLKTFVEDGRLSPNEIVESLNTRLMVLESNPAESEASKVVRQMHHRAENIRAIHGFVANVLDCWADKLEDALEEK